MFVGASGSQFWRRPHRVHVQAADGWRVRCLSDYGTAGRWARKESGGGTSGAV